MTAPSKLTVEQAQELAQRWAATVHLAHPELSSVAPALDADELSGLLAWVREYMQQEVARLETPSCESCGRWPTCGSTDRGLRCDACCVHNDDAACDVFVAEMGPPFTSLEEVARVTGDALGIELTPALALCDLSGFPGEA